MCDSHRKQGTLWLSFAEATREHLFSQLRLSRQSGKGAGVRTIVGCGQDDCGPMCQRQSIAANIEPRVMSFKQPIPRAVGNVVISHSSMPALQRITDSTRTSSVGPKCANERTRSRGKVRRHGRQRDGGRAARVPAASNRDRFAATEHQRDRDGAPVLLQGDARPAGIAQPCPHCGGRMFVIETFEPGCQPRHPPTAPLAAIRIDTS
jgi:hypothetical protein